MYSASSKALKVRCSGSHMHVLFRTGFSHDQLQNMHNTCKWVNLSLGQSNAIKFSLLITYLPKVPTWPAHNYRYMTSRSSYLGCLATSIVSWGQQHHRLLLLGDHVM